VDVTRSEPGRGGLGARKRGGKKMKFQNSNISGVLALRVLCFGISAISRSLLTFRRNLLPSFSGSNIKPNNSGCFVCRVYNCPSLDPISCHINPIYILSPRFSNSPFYIVAFSSTFKSINYSFLVSLKFSADICLVVYPRNPSRSQASYEFS
jgi:hypothetical protein